MIALPRASFHRLPWPIVLGHRGSRTRAPENTLEAIEEAAAAGADGIEVDVRTCATGELVVAHDATLERVSRNRDRRAVAALPLAELRRVELEGGGRIPTLVEVLSLCRERELCLNVELKRNVPRRLRAVTSTARLLRSFELPAVVSSFDPTMLVAFRIMAPRVASALLLDERGLSSQLGLLGRPLGAMAVHPERRLVNRARVDGWHALGLRVLAWTVNDEAEIARLLADGVDGIISDDPALARRAVDLNGR